MEILKNCAIESFWAKLILLSVTVLFFSKLVNLVIMFTSSIFKIDCISEIPKVNKSDNLKYVED